MKMFLKLDGIAVYSKNRLTEVELKRV